MIRQATQLLGWNPEDSSEKSSFHHQVSTSKPLSQVIWYLHKAKQEKRGDENFRWDPAVPSQPPLSTCNDEPKAETTAKRKALACPHCLQIWVSQQPPGLLYSPNRQEDLSSLSRFTGQASELLPAIQPQCPAGRGQLKVPDKHSASSQGSPGWRKDQLSHLSHTPVCSQQQQFRRVAALAKKTDTPPAKAGGGAFAPTRTIGFYTRSWGKSSSVMKQKP